jgi:hypothetical protein
VLEPLAARATQGHCQGAELCSRLVVFAIAAGRRRIVACQRASARMATHPLRVDVILCCPESRVGQDATQ